MKKTGLIFIAVFILSFKTNDDEKEYIVKLTLPQWQLVMQVVDQSNAPHSQVKAVQELVIPQLNKQIADTVKKK